MIPSKKNLVDDYKQMKTLEKKGLQQNREKINGKLGLWREKARRYRKKDLKRDFTVEIHQILQTRGKGSLYSP